MEDAYMGKAVERVFLPLMRLTIPELGIINLPIEGVFHNLMIVSIRKSYPGRARKVMNAIWSLGQAMFTKCIIVVDEDVDVQDLPDVTPKVLNHIDPERDIQFMLGPVDSLDHPSRLANYGSKMGIDATRKWPSEGFTRPWPDEILMDAKTKALVDSKWKALGKRVRGRVTGVGGALWTVPRKVMMRQCEMVWPTTEAESYVCETGQSMKAMELAVALPNSVA
jgi:4-hydroxy-3-polyprenylbenzoate decarboxylase